ncbi:hypothetical protein KY346_03790 [Candidatus Woesearchaeota archaeon]|nr:hypothetical protein [Candidatus Woesearchaeota archaeon]
MDRGISTTIFLLGILAGAIITPAFKTAVFAKEVLLSERITAGMFVLVVPALFLCSLFICSNGLPKKKKGGKLSNKSSNEQTDLSKADLILLLIGIPVAVFGATLGTLLDFAQNYRP